MQASGHDSQELNCIRRCPKQCGQLGCRDAEPPPPTGADGKCQPAATAGCALGSSQLFLAGAAEQKDLGNLERAAGKHFSTLDTTLDHVTLCLKGLAPLQDPLNDFAGLICRDAP